MDANVVALKLYLDELGIPPSIGNIDQRVQIQKSVYIGQIFGADLGYRFNWYLKGPYSPSLTQDYYALNVALQEKDSSATGKALVEPYKQKIVIAKQAMQRPATFPDRLSDEKWYELLASTHYLRCVSCLNAADARSVLAEQKADIAPYYDMAANRLAQFQQHISGGFPAS